MTNTSKTIERVVLCAPGFPVSFDDPHKPFLLDHALALAAAGVNVTVVCPAHPDAPRWQLFSSDQSAQSNGASNNDPEPAAAVEVVRVRFAPASQARRIAQGNSYRQFTGWAAFWLLPLLVRLSWTSAKLARGSGAQVIHGHWWFPAGVAAVAAALVSKEAKSAVHVHGTDLALTNNWLARAFARRTLKQAHTTATVSERLAAELEPLLKPSLRSRTASQFNQVLGKARGQDSPSQSLQSKDHVAVVPMPLRHQNVPFQPPPADGPILAVGRLVPEKGFDVLLAAVANRAESDSLASQEMSAPQVVIVGEGPERQRLADLANQLGVTLELAGEVPPSQLASYYQQARLVVVPSRREGYGLVIAQGLAAGRTVVASDVGAASSLIEPGVNGLLVPPNEVAALAAALASADPNWGINGPPSAAHLNASAHAATLLEAYQAEPANQSLPSLAVAAPR